MGPPSDEDEGDAGPLEPRTPLGMRVSPERSPVDDGPEDDENGERAGPWVRVSGDHSILAAFRSEIRSRCGEVEIYTAVGLDRAGLVHSTPCRRAGPISSIEYLLCSKYSETPVSDHRLVMGVNGVLHSNLACSQVRELRGGCVYRYCPVCFFAAADA